MGEIIKALGWPHVTLLFAVLFVYVFRKPLSELISRTTSISKIGLKTAPAPEAQREKQKTEAVQELLLEVCDSVALRNIEGRIRSFLTEKGLETEGDTTKVLVKHLGAALLLLAFEQIYNLIFGSQIYLLKQLNEVAGQGQKKDFVTAHFDSVRGLFKENLGDWSLDQYMAFLTGRSLVTVDGETYHITHLGVEYLTWMARNGRSESRPL